jgi:DNA mismatch repair protein MutS
MVERRLERVVTPGIKIFSNASDSGSDSLAAAAVVASENDVAIAFSDVQTGSIEVREGLALSSFSQEIQKISPAEMVLAKTNEGKPIDRRLSWVRETERILKSNGLKFRPETYTESAKSGGRNFSALAGYSALGSAGKKAVRLLVNYIDETTLDAQVTLTSVQVRTYERAMMIDASTRINLELVRNTRDSGKEGTLYEHLDRTKTAGGTKLLRHWILNPLGFCSRRQCSASGESSKSARSHHRLRTNCRSTGAEYRFSARTGRRA